MLFYFACGLMISLRDLFERFRFIFHGVTWALDLVGLNCLDCQIMYLLEWGQGAEIVFQLYVRLLMCSCNME